MLGTEEELSENVHDETSSVCLSVGVFSITVNIRGGSRQSGAYNVPGVVFVMGDPAGSGLQDRRAKEKKLK